MSEMTPEQPPAGWVILDPDGNVIEAGAQAVLDASASAGEER